MIKKSIKHFHYEFPLPEDSTLRPYEHPEIATKKKNKTKLTKFTYYQPKEGPSIKILFIDDERYIDQGRYPFTDPAGTLHLFKDIGLVERMIVTEAVYIGHFVQLKGEGESIQLVIKKMNQAKISLDTFEVQTEDDHFEVIQVGNLERFNQFLKIQAFNPHAQMMSIRVMIEAGRVIDFQFFQREAKLKKNKLYQHEEIKKQA